MNLKGKKGGICMKALNINESFKKINEFWSPRIISSVENCYVKLARVKGDDIPFHTHENEDELFIIHRGSLVLEFENSSIELNEGDVYLVEKGIAHKPVAKEVCEIILIEKKTTAHTGGNDVEMTRSLEEQMRPLE
jgi:mannose-6-phosphate isomerase-like protein (cupin superfamily)